jgi:hypothetical protein
MTNRLEMRLTRLVAGFSPDVGGRRRTIVPVPVPIPVPFPVPGPGPGTEPPTPETDPRSRLGAAAGKCMSFDMAGTPRPEPEPESELARACDIDVAVELRVICKDEREGPAVESRLVRDEADAEAEPPFEPPGALVGKKRSCEAGMRTMSRTRREGSACSACAATGAGAGVDGAFASACPA